MELEIADIIFFIKFVRYPSDHFNIFDFMQFSAHHTRSSSNFMLNINLLVVHNPLVLLVGRLVACSARTRADRETVRQNDYCNPRCACAPRVNKISYSIFGEELNTADCTYASHVSLCMSNVWR